MRKKLQDWGRANRDILVNTFSLYGTTAVTSLLGFVYWWVAARYFTPDQFGLASAAISSVILLGAFGTLGLDTLFIGELAKSMQKAGAYILTGTLIISAVSIVLGLIYLLLVPVFSPELIPLLGGTIAIVIFVSGVVLQAVGLALDGAAIGLMIGRLQLQRNTVFAVAKLIILWGAGLAAVQDGSIAILAAWASGNLLSFIPMALSVLRRSEAIHLRPEWNLLRHFGRAALSHHFLNLALLTPGYLLPLIVLSILSPTANAIFHTTWMIASMGFLVSAHLSTVLYAVGAGSPKLLTQKLRLTMKLSITIGICTALGLLLFSDLILGVFGETYQQGANGLRILGFGVFAFIIKYHFIAIQRVRGNIGSTVFLMTILAVIEVIVATIGGHLGGVVGLCLGIVLVNYGELIFFLPAVYSVYRGSQSQNSVHTAGRRSQVAGAIQQGE